MISKLQNSRQEKKHRHQYKITESTRRYYKFLKLQSRVVGFMPIQKLGKVEIKNFCLISGSAHSIYSRRFRMSRHQIKKYFSFVNGLRLSSW